MTIVFDRPVLAVPDVRKSAAFLQEVLGGDLEPIEDGERLHLGVGRVDLVQAGGLVPKGIRQFVWSGDDLGSALAALNSHGVTLETVDVEGGYPAWIQADPATAFGVPIVLTTDSTARPGQPPTRGVLHHMAVACHDGQAVHALFQSFWGGGLLGPNDFGDFQAVTLDVPEPYCGFIFPKEQHKGFVAKFLDTQGPGVHHLAFEMFDMDGAIETIEGHGVRLVNRSPAEGPVQDVFIHPSNPTSFLLRLTRGPISARRDRLGRPKAE